MATTDPTAPAPKTRTDVLTGYTLSEPPFLSNAEIENELDQQLVGTLIAGAKLADPLNGTSFALQAAAVLLGTRPHAHPSTAFDMGVFRDNMIPSVLHACLKRHHPEISRQKAMQLVTDDNRQQVQRACLELMHYRFGSPTEGAAAPANLPNENPPTTQELSEISANAE